MLRPKKNSYKEVDNDKKFVRLENSPTPPHNFCNGPSPLLYVFKSMKHVSMTVFFSKSPLDTNTQTY